MDYSTYTYAFGHNLVYACGLEIDGNSTVANIPSFEREFRYD